MYINEAIIPVRRYSGNTIAFWPLEESEDGDFAPPGESKIAQLGGMANWSFIATIPELNEEMPLQREIFSFLHPWEETNQIYSSTIFKGSRILTRGIHFWKITTRPCKGTARVITGLYAQAAERTLKKAINKHAIVGCGNLNRNRYNQCQTKHHAVIVKNQAMYACVDIESEVWTTMGILLDTYRKQIVFYLNGEQIGILVNIPRSRQGGLRPFAQIFTTSLDEQPTTFYWTQPRIQVQSLQRECRKSILEYVEISDIGKLKLANGWTVPIKIQQFLRTGNLKEVRCNKHKYYI